MRLVKVSDVANGQVIAADVTNVHRQVIMPAGTAVDVRRRSILKVWGIQEVAVETPADIEPSVSEPAASPEVGDKVPSLCGLPVDAHPALLELADAIARNRPKLGGLVTDPAPALSPRPAAAPGRPRSPSLTAQTIVGSAKILPSLPSVYFQVDRVINHPTSSAADIAAVLGNDQGLCARLLRIANSAFYGFPRRIETVSEAVRIIGTRQLRDLVLATVVLMQFKGIDAKLVNMTSFWRHGLSSGIAARSIAAMRRESNIERFFVAGLLHDIGSLVLYQVQPALAQAAIEQHRASDVSLDSAERALIGCHHGAIGAELMSVWKLPHFFQEVAAGHHATDARSLTPDSALIWLADLVVMALQTGSNGEARPARFNPAIWDLVGIAPSALQTVVDDSARLLAETQRMFLAEDAGP